MSTRQKIHWYIIAVLTIALIFTTFVNFNQAKGAGAEYEYKMLVSFFPL